MHMYGWLLELHYLSLKCHLTLRSVDLTVHLGQVLSLLSDFCSGNADMLLTVTLNSDKYQADKRDLSLILQN